MDRRTPAVVAHNFSSNALCSGKRNASPAATTGACARVEFGKAASKQAPSATEISGMDLFMSALLDRMTAIGTDFERKTQN
jgi:hypothetical protein